MAASAAVTVSISSSSLTTSFSWPYNKLFTTPSLSASSSSSSQARRTNGQAFKLRISSPRFCYNNHPHLSPAAPLLYATLNSPRGFGPTRKKTRKTKKSKTGYNDDEEEDDDGEEEEEQDSGIIPEVVTNRMISRMGFSVGIPLFTGLLFFPFFYYLKVGLKIDVPTWVPLIVSFFFFGSALVGVSYGIVSSSWDPMREGSLLGWNEAQKNWPVFWQSLWGRSREK